MDKTNQELKIAKYMGGIDSIIMPLQALGLVGIILVFIAIKKISDITVKKEIFRNYLISFILGALIGVLLIVAYVSIFAVAGLSQAQPDLSKTLASFNVAFAVSFFVIFYTLVVVSAFFKKKSFVMINKKLEVEAFETAGNLYFLGAILSIILIGFVIMLIAWIYEIIAFFSVPEELPHSSMSSQSAVD